MGVLNRYNITAIGSAGAIGAINEASAQWRDGKLGGGGDLEKRRRAYVALTTVALIGIPILAARQQEGLLATMGEGAFDGLAAILFRNMTAAMFTTVPCFTPI